MEVNVKEALWPRLGSEGAGQILVRRIGGFFGALAESLGKKFDAMVCEACGFTDQEED